MMGSWKLRCRALLDSWFRGIVVIVLLLGIVGGWLTYTTQFASGTATEQRTETVWETTGEFDHAAPVTEPNSVFQEGATLRNRSVYFTAISPELDGTVAVSYDGDEQGAVDTTVTVWLVMRGVDGEEESQTVLWEQNRSLATRSVESVAPGRTVEIPFEIDIRAVENRTEQIRTDLGGGAGQTEILVRATAGFQGTVGGTTVDETETYTLPVVIEESTYRLGETSPTVQQYETTRTVTVQRSGGQLGAVGGPVLVGGSLVGLGTLVVLRRRGHLSLTERERDRLRYLDERGTFDEWISTVQLPQTAFERPRAEATTLGGLVDLAIDTDNSVIEDPDEDVYYVLQDGYLYTYRPPVVDRPAPATPASRGGVETEDSGVVDSKPDDSPEQTADTSGSTQQ